MNASFVRKSHFVQLVSEVLTQHITQLVSSTRLSLACISGVSGPQNDHVPDLALHLYEAVSVKGSPQMPGKVIQISTPHNLTFPGQHTCGSSAALSNLSTWFPVIGWTGHWSRRLTLIFSLAVPRWTRATCPYPQAVPRAENTRPCSAWLRGLRVQLHRETKDKKAILLELPPQMIWGHPGRLESTRDRAEGERGKMSK